MRIRLRRVGKEPVRNGGHHPGGGGEHDRRQRRVAGLGGGAAGRRRRPQQDTHQYHQVSGVRPAQRARPAQGDGAVAHDRVHRPQPAAAARRGAHTAQRQARPAGARAQGAAGRQAGPRTHRYVLYYVIRECGCARVSS